MVLGVVSKNRNMVLGGPRHRTVEGGNYGAWKENSVRPGDWEMILGVVSKSRKMVLGVKAALGWRC